ncbi:MAG: 4Fe-4S binding protein [Lachnospiraceae bacterium]|nr:4Fe-4S binding protein [Lachnospiraceae bacterium]
MGFLKGKIYQGPGKKLCLPGLNCYSCPGALGACPIGSLQAVLGSPKFQMSFYVVGFFLFTGAILGRVVCGFLCPFGLVQDLLYKIPFFAKRKNMPGHKGLVWIKYVVLALMVVILPMFAVNAYGISDPWFCKYLCPSGTLFGGIPLIATNDGLQQALGGLFIWKMSVLLVILVWSLWVYRPFCKYLCPLGAIYGWFNPIALSRFQMDKEACIDCKKCKAACPMDIPVYAKPNSAECIKCGKCLQACPTDCIQVALLAKRSPQTKKTEKQPAESGG